MMRNLILMLAASLPLFGAWPNGYAYRRTLTIQSGRVPSSQNNFPALVCFNGSNAPCDNPGLNATDLKTAANGGRVQNATTCCAAGGAAPADLIFTSDANGSSLLPWDVEKYVAASGELVAWVNMTAADGAVIYMFYGKAPVTTFQSTYTSVWSDYVGVWHFPDKTTLDAHDSTANGNDGRVGGLSAAVGQIDGGFAETGGGAVTLASSSSLNITGDISMSAWVSPTDTGGYYICLGFQSGVYAGYAFQLYGANLLRLYTDGAGWANSNTVSDLRFAWHYVTVSLSGSTASFYVDGAPQGSAVSSPGSSWSGERYLGPGWQGSMDEVRLSNVSRSADRVAAEYNNQSAPASFWAAGGATSQSGGGGRERVQVILFGQ